MALFTTERALRTVLAAAAVAVGACSPSAPESFSALDLETVRKVDQAYARAWLDDDPEQLMALFAEEAVISPSGRSTLKGRAEIRHFFFPPGGARTAVSRFELEQDRVHGSGTLAFVRGHFVLEFTYAGQPFASRGSYNTLLLKQSDGQWRIQFRAWNDMAPAAS